MRSAAFILYAVAGALQLLGACLAARELVIDKVIDGGVISDLALTRWQRFRRRISEAGPAAWVGIGAVAIGGACGTAGDFCALAA